MVRVNFVTSGRNQMMKTPLCIYFANDAKAPIIDLDVVGIQPTNISEIMDKILEDMESDTKKSLQESSDLISLRIGELVFSPMLTRFQMNGEELAEETLTSLLQRSYSERKKEFIVNYKEISVVFQHGRFVINKVSEKQDIHSSDVFIDCPGGSGIKYGKNDFISQIQAMQKSVKHSEIFFYHVLDYNCIVDKRRKLTLKGKVTQERLNSLIDAFRRIINSELKEILGLIDGIVLIVNFYNFKRDFGTVIRDFYRESAYDDLESISSGKRMPDLYWGIGKIIKEVYRLDECSGLKEFLPDKYKNAYNILTRSLPSRDRGTRSILGGDGNLLENSLTKIGADQR